MATPTPQILRVLWEEVEVSYTDVALDVLSLYEFVITIGDEARVVWKRPWTMSSILFLSNRWIGMVGMNIVGVTPLTPEPPRAEFSVYSI
ncbi:hypothetical protein PHLGIDRAFT_122475 [Phlebiopsis gigantea 11061_1 CR5-6]|uniref:DUF6533 domain-containing protein n=1 Tax=Phlebiopsis gigantea (strain 11061_1 CR5-6) TaxID=745531 RepID=A0A0C3RR42_PHLG1|nr:hypothetical protein PHLGIDRAFT_122475 [Phlebiopsis gigantea 11061_1 CR5-6]